MNKKDTFDGVQSRTIFCFWTGDNPMSETRKSSLQQMSEITKCTVELITKDNLKLWEVEEEPIHIAYEFLSAVHRADYLRAYFMCHYGGGYSDVKIPTGSWTNAFDVLTRYENLWVIGYPEANEGCIAGIDDCILYKKMQSVYWRMIGNGSYVCRKGSPLVKEWLQQVHMVLDEKVHLLHAYPAPHPRAHNQEDPKYALKWTEICGHIFHPLVYKYIDHVAPLLPPPNCSHYA